MARWVSTSATATRNDAVPPAICRPGRAPRAAAMTARLAAHVWVAAYLARLQAAGIAVYVAARGDATSGAVIVKAATLDGRARAVQRITDPMTGARRWDLLAEGDEPAVDAALARARSRDRDLWLIEVEDRHGRDLLDEPGLSD